MLDSIHTAILYFLAAYYVCQRVDIQEALKLDERTARRRLSYLLDLKYIQRTNAQVVFPDINGASAPAYTLTARGAEFLYCETKDESFLQCNTYTPNWQTLLHTLGIARFHRLLVEACAANLDVALESFVPEWQVADHHAKEPEKRYRLFSLIRSTPRLVVAADASFVLCYKGQRRGYFLELDRSTNSLQRIARSKTPGYAAMAEQKLFARHFPGAENIPFRVLFVTQNENRRDGAARLVAKFQGAPLWRFLSLTRKIDNSDGSFTIEHVQPEMLFQVWDVLDCEGEKRTIIRKEEGQ